MNGNQIIHAQSVRLLFAHKTVADDHFVSIYPFEFHCIADFSSLLRFIASVAVTAALHLTGDNGSMTCNNIYILIAIQSINNQSIFSQSLAIFKRTRSMRAWVIR